MASRSYDKATDSALDAIRELVQTNCNSELSSLFESEPAVQATYGFPFDLMLLSQTKTPAMYVTREREQLMENGLFRGAYSDKAVDFKLVYVAPETGVNKLGSRWPMLKAVWDCTYKALMSGAIAGGSSSFLCEEGGIINYDNRALPSVSFSYATDADVAFPIFTATLRLIERPFDVAGTLDGLADANDLLAEHLLVGLPEEEQPFLISLHQISETVIVPPPASLLSAFESDGVDPFERA